MTHSLARHVLYAVLITALWPRSDAVMFAQRGQNAMLLGSVRDASGGVIQGATITITSPQLIGSSEDATTDARGSYRVLFLAPGIYEAVAQAPGFRSVVRKSVELQPGVTTTIDFELEVAGVDTTVTIDVAPPVVDLRASSSPTLINRRLIDNLPLPRTVYTLVNLAPGALNDVAYGGSLVANPLFIDGVSGNEPGWGTPVSAPNLRWIDEVQIVGPGAEAEYGEFTGAQVQAVTRSGGDAFSGVADFWTTRPGWTGNNRSSLPDDLRDRFRPVEVLQRWDANAQVGGPVVKRKVWFFAGAEHFRDAYRPVSFSGVPRRADEPSVTTTDRKYIVKLTGALRSGVRAEGFVARTSSEQFGLNASPLVSREALGVSDTTGSIWSGRLLWQLGNRGAIEARHGGTVTSIYVGPGESMQGGPSARFDQVTGAWSGNYPFHSTARYEPVRTAAVVTYWAGQARPHELRSGVEHEHASLYSRDGLVGGRLFLDADGRPSTVNIASDATYRPKQNRWTWFGQDSWSAAERLTLNMGARVSAYRGGVPTHEQAFSAVTVSPRLGAAWVVNSRHQTVARAHYGRYHDHPATSFYDFLDPLSDAPTIVAQVVGPEEFVEIARTLSGVDARIDPELGFPFAREMLVGVESALPRGFTAKAQVILRDFEDTVGFVDGGSQWVPTERRDPGPDGRAGTSDDGELIMVFVNDGRGVPSLELTNPEAAYRRYRAVQFVATKRHADQLNVQASYTWSRTVGNYNNLFASNAAGGDLGTNGSFTDPNRLINTAGRTPQDFTHDLKVLATHRLHLLGGFNFSGVYRYQSGRTWARSARFPPQILSLVFVEARATRQLPAAHTLDIRVEKTWRPGGARATVGWFAEIFNVGNQGVALRVNNVSGPNLGLPTQWSEPRVVRAGARVMF